MSKQTKFSIVVPVYNTKEDYLRYCFNTIIKQNYDNYEVIIVDDGSNLETKKVLKTYQDVFQIITQEKNKGMLEARFVGLQKAKGEYIMFVDSDDALDLDCLKTLNEVILQYHSDIVMIDSPRFESDIQTETLIPKNSFFTPGVVNKEEVIKQLLSLHINSIVHKICKKELLDYSLADLDSSIINGDDLQQSAYVVLKANSFYYLDKDVYYYRINETQQYYSPNRIHDINFMIPAYNLIFKDFDQYNQYLPTFKNACQKAVISTCFSFLNDKNSFKEKKVFLDQLKNQPIISLINSVNVKTNLLTNFVFKLFINRHYYLLNIVSKIYNLMV